MGEEPLGDISDVKTLNPQQLGFMCGLEIHQQLNTGKLHSREKGELYDYTIDTLPSNLFRTKRKLRAASGEGGKIDIAARFETRRNRSFVYVKSPNAGLIELDDQPPLEHDKDAVEIALVVSAMLNAHPVGTLQAMRKTVVDGSNTSGFQRTTLVSTHGKLETKTGDVGISVICLEEDSARKLSSELTSNGEVVTWNLDRLGIPLIEIATDPDVKNPEHAKETAIALGGLLRDTRKVRRGLGSIRQDLNVSIACGDRVEIKGCQDLEWIPRIIELEIARQLHFYRLANELRETIGEPKLPPNRDDDDEELEMKISQKLIELIPFEINDCTHLLKDCESKMIQNSLKNNSSILCVKLPYLSGRLGTKILDSEGAQLPRLGRELAGAAKLAGVAGIFHSDELPAYGITESNVEEIKKEVNCSESDAFALCVAPEWQAELALESVVLRARKAWQRSIQEVRNVVVKKGAPEDGTTTAMRPLPTGARMYPETDVPSFELTKSHWDEISNKLPLTQSERLDRLTSFEISSDQQKQLVSRQLDDEFFAGVSGNLDLELNKLPAKAWASMLLETSRIQIAEGVGIDINQVSIKMLAALLLVRESGGVTRDGLVDLGINMILEGGTNLDGEVTNFIEQSMKKAEILGLNPSDLGSIEEVIDRILEERADFVAERGMGAMGPLMGVVIKELGGGADGKIISKILGERLRGN
ncbi:MAG: Aspartyl/glutamyl-tRNA(Asn/Gln) amidotransferase subunit B [Methanobacteriota archaeon]|nr:MAG: Aspartyl/glutamyl-tRNA(Asn/Gln) amidotransferase subunit B [Euryarchaeota archaeon]